MHHLAMKIKGLALLGLIPALLLSSMATSFADSTPTPTPSSSASTDFQTLMDQYKLNIDKYRALQNLNSEPQSAALQFKAAMDMYRMLQDSRD